MDDENFNIPCIEEDLENMPAEELDNYYQILGNGGILELNWKCIGRRPPTPDEKDEVKVETPVKESPKNVEFDFLEDSSPQQTLMRVRNQNSAPKGSAKKKTTNFAGVIDQMKKHGRIQRETRSTVTTTVTTSTATVSAVSSSATATTTTNSNATSSSSLPS